MFLRKLVGKRRFWGNEVSKLEKVLHIIFILISFCCSHVAGLESLVFLWPRRVYMGEAAKHLLFEGFQAGCHVVLRGSRGTLCVWYSSVSKVSNLAEVSHEMLVLLRPRVSSRVSGLPVASPCLWGKLQNQPLLFEGFQAGCHVVLRGSRGTLWHSNLFDS